MVNVPYVEVYPGLKVDRRLMVCDAMQSAPNGLILIAKNNKMTGVKTRGNFENSQKIQFCEFIENSKRSR